MNGRCENDALDTAVDVCDTCGGEYCESCLIQAKGKKHPICRQCAIGLSGVRSNAKPVRKQSRKEAKKSRTALRAAAAAPNEQSGFLFFDEDDSFTTTESLNNPDAPAAEEPEERRSKSSGFAGRFRRKTDVVDAPPPPADAIRSVQIGGDPDAEPDGMDTHEHDVSNLPGQDDQDDQDGRGASATELLARLKEREDLPAMPSLPDFSESATEPAPEDIWLPPTANGDSWNLPELDGDAEAAPAAASFRAESDEQSDDDAEPSYTHQTPAEQIYTGRPTEPEEDAQSNPPVAAPMDMSPPVFVSEKELKAKAPADSDDEGNWVPPTLRGIVPKEVREANELPRRRR